MLLTVGFYHRNLLWECSGVFGVILDILLSSGSVLFTQILGMDETNDGDDYEVCRTVSVPKLLATVGESVTGLFMRIAAILEKELAL